ncbi:MAG: hypothetical protein Q4E61_04590, partial [Alphaproteobacteria bacterium]|nr:hypothetical protein [Alphaproteobacteria bacterium]
SLKFLRKMPIYMAKGQTKRKITQMGKAASQARLLMLTARMHDIEYKAQAIQNAKIQLATQSDEVYKDYLAALDAKTLTITGVDGQVVTANFNNLCGRNAIELASKDGTNRQGVALYDDKGRLIVTDDIFEDYNNFGKGDDPYAFAIYALTGQKVDSDELKNVERDLMQEELAEAIKTYGNDLKREFNIEREISGYSDMVSIVNDNFPNDNAKNDNKVLYKKAMEILNNYEATEKNARYKLYRNPENVANVFEKVHGINADIDASDFDEDDFAYYANEYKKIEANNGYIVKISDFNGICGGNANTDSDWLQNQIQSGKITMDSFSFNKKNGDIEFTATSPTTDSSISYSTTTSIDKTELAKVEAKYEHDMKEINKKDKAFDMDLSKLDAERTAIKTEYEQVKTVTKDNIERTFGIFS